MYFRYNYDDGLSGGIYLALLMNLGFIWNGVATLTCFNRFKLQNCPVGSNDNVAGS